MPAIPHDPFRAHTDAPKAEEALKAEEAPKAKTAPKEPVKKPAVAPSEPEPAVDTIKK